MKKTREIEDIESEPIRTLEIIPDKCPKEQAHSLLSQISGKDVRVKIHDYTLNPVYRTFIFEGRVALDKQNRYSLFQDRKRVFPLEYHSSRDNYFSIEVKLKHN